jgi:GNAT superfamily N-acetyltransferase
MEDHLMTKSDLIIINNIRYDFQVTIVDEINLHFLVKIISGDKTESNSNRSFSKIFTLNILKTQCPLFYNKNNIQEVFDKILIKLEKKEISIQESFKNLLIIFKFTIDEEKTESIFKLSLNYDENKKLCIPGNEKLEMKQATVEDIPIILNFIMELAEYEKSINKVIIREENLKECIFSSKAHVKCEIAYYENIPVGFIVYFFNFSTWTGRGLYLDDLYIRPEFRGKGIGKNLLAYLAKVAVENNCKRFEWVCLDWNEPSIEFYKKLGAVPMDEWTVYRLQGKNLELLGEFNNITV